VFLNLNVKFTASICFLSSTVIGMVLLSVFILCSFIGLYLLHR
jgi:hypothetical protein